MQVKLAYGKQGLWVELPDRWRAAVVEPAFVPGLSDPPAIVRAALRAPHGALPLREVVRPGDRVGVVFSDITRPMPHRLVLPAVLQELRSVPTAEVVLFNALGTHRANTDAELRQMLGDDIVDAYRIVQNDAFDPRSQVYLGTSARGHEIWLNADVMACDVKVLTGFIEPHLFAGFSGGGKAILPGMAGLQTVLGNHDANMLADPNATWGVTGGNPVWEEIQEVARQAGRLFLVNVTLNRDKEVTGVFVGDSVEAHAAGCAFVRETAMVSVPHPFEIVVTTNSGFPLDLNLYQAVKGMSAASQIVAPGGAIVVAAECWDGIPEHGLYQQLLRSASSVQELLDIIRAPGFLKQDQWQVQIQAQVQLKAQVHVFSHHLSDEQIRAALFEPCRNIERTVERLLDEYGSRATVCVLPEGPQTIPYVAG